MKIRYVLSVCHTLCILAHTKSKIFLRKIHLWPKNSELINMKNKYNGRCFIVCTGASLTKEDVELLSKEKTMSMNSICYLYDKTEWRPTFYLIQDLRAFGELEPYMTKSSINFCSEQMYKKNREKCKEFSFIPYFLNLDIHGSRIDKKFITRGFSENCDNYVQDGYTVTYSAMQLAVYLGFNEIVLLGCDNNLSTTGNKHFVNMENDKKLNWNGWDERMQYAYRQALKYAEGKNIKIINATRGGRLEIFPRKKLEDLLDEES